MLLDLQNMFTAASGDTIVSTAGTLVTSQCIDLWNGNAAIAVPPLGGPEIVDFGRGRPLETFLEVTTAFVGGTNVIFQLVAADSAGTAIGGLVTAQLGTYATLTNPTVLTQTGTIVTATLVAGYQPRIAAIPEGTSQRYLFVVLITTGTFSAGVLQAGLVVDGASNVPTL